MNVFLLNRFFKILSIILLVLIEPLFSQNYIPLPETNAKWSLICPTQNGPFLYYQTFYGDTIIGHKTYKKLGEVSYYTPNNIVYSAAIRQDTLNQKVYFVPKNSSNEYLLFDFSLNIGDTISVKRFDSQTGLFISTLNYTVVNKDSININYQYRKRLYLHSIYNSYSHWIEGIGSICGLMDVCIVGEICLNDLICFEHNGKVLYPPQATSHPSCDSMILASIKELNSINTPKIVSILPNPFSDQAIIRLNHPSFIPSTFLIYSTFGEEIIKIPLHSMHTEVKRNNLQSGLYLYKLIDKNGKVIERGKIIVQEK